MTSYQLPRVPLLARVGLEATMLGLLAFGGTMVYSVVRQPVFPECEWDRATMEKVPSFLGRRCATKSEYEKEQASHEVEVAVGWFLGQTLFVAGYAANGIGSKWGRVYDDRRVVIREAIDQCSWEERDEVIRRLEKGESVTIDDQM